MANPTTRREHAGAANAAALTTSMSNSDTAFTISTNTGWPTGGVGTFFVVIEPSTTSEEKVLCQTQSSGLVTVASGGRGADGTTARTHPINSVTYPIWAATEADELNLHAASTTAVHGVAGAVVGTTDAQVLTNKTIAWGSNTVTGIPESGITNLVADLAAKQPLDADLTSVAALATTGIVTRSASNTFVTRQLTSPTGTISFVNQAGLLGDPQLEAMGILPVELPGSVDLNTLVTPGVWCQTSNAEAASGTNYPIATAGLLEVENNITGVMVWQRYTTYQGSGNNVYVRAYYSLGTGWSAWQQLGYVQGAWTAWTPNYTGISAIGNAAVVAKYQQVGKTVHARFQLTVGSTTTFTGSTLAIGLPVAAAADYVSVGQPMGSLWLLDSSAGLPGRYDGTAIYWNTTANGSVFFMSSINAAAAHAGGDTVGSTLPFTLAVSDHVAFQITYEAA